MKGFVKDRFGKQVKLKDLHNIKQQIKQEKQNNQSDAEQIVSVVKNMQDSGHSAEILADDGGSIQMIFIQMRQAFQKIQTLYLLMPLTKQTNKVALFSALL